MPTTMEELARLMQILMLAVNAHQNGRVNFAMKREYVTLNAMKVMAFVEVIQKIPINWYAIVNQDTQETIAAHMFVMVFFAIMWATALLIPLGKRNVNVL